ncbi:hypothetical protein QP705_10300, partial [Limosilactobacillus reuteri]|nr:hypothetical protein [Limosilactobacillus reuteri]
GASRAWVKNVKGRLKTWGLSFQMTFFNHFCGRIPRDGACVVGRHRSEGFVREPLKISNICPSIIFVGRTHATDTESAKTDRKFKYERSSETYIGFSDDLFVVKEWDGADPI